MTGWLTLPAIFSPRLWPSFGEYAVTTLPAVGHRHLIGPALRGLVVRAATGFLVVVTFFPVLRTPAVDGRVWPVDGGGEVLLGGGTSLIRWPAMILSWMTMLFHWASFR